MACAAGGRHGRRHRPPAAGTTGGRLGGQAAGRAGDRTGSLQGGARRSGLPLLIFPPLPAFPLASPRCGVGRPSPGHAGGGVCVICFRLLLAATVLVKPCT